MGTDSREIVIRVHKTKKDFKDLKNSWDNLVLAAGANVFQLHEWQYLWWDVFSSNNRLHIITFWLEDKLIAILPFFIQEKKFSRFRFVRTLQFIGSHISTVEGEILPVDKAFAGYLDIIVHPEHLELISRELPVLLEELIEEVDQISLDEIPEHSKLKQWLPSLDRSDKWTLKKTEASKCSQCLIGSDWDLYLSTLSRSTRKHIRRGLRSVYDDEVFEIKEVKDPVEFDRLFNELVRLHQDRWHHLNMPGIFTDRRMDEFIRSTSLKLFRNGFASIHWAEKDDEVFAVELTYKFNHTIYALQTGFDADSKYSKYSPGNLIIYHLMKSGIDNGYLVFDWLIGSEKYKSSTASLVLQNQKLTLTNNSRLTGIKVFLTDSSTDLLTKLHIERLRISIYFENYTFLIALKKYIGRIISYKTPYSD